MLAVWLETEKEVLRNYNHILLSNSNISVIARKLKLPDYFSDKDIVPSTSYALWRWIDCTYRAI